MNEANTQTAEEALAAGDSNSILEHNAMSEEERQKQMEAWRDELVNIEEEIKALSAVLTTKTRRSAELKRLLGITVWKEVSDDINQGIKNVKQTNVYQTVESKVGQVTKAVTDAPIYQKTTSLIGGFTGGISNKLGQMRHSESFKSFEERASSAMETVKRRLSNTSPTQ